MSFLSTANPTSVMKFYSNVMDDVLTGVREAFLDEGVDEQVLQELRQMWEAKVQASKAIDPPEIVEPQPPPLQVTQPPLNDSKCFNQTKQTEARSLATNGVPVSSTQPSRAKPAVVASVLSTPSGVATPVTSSTSNIPSIQQPQSQLSQPPQLPQALPQPVASNLQDKLVPIQLTLPAPAGSQDSQSRIYNIQVPASALASDQLQRILTAQVISATMALPTNVASTLLQQHVTAALQSQANHSQTNTNSNNSSTPQINGDQGVLLTDNSNNRQFPYVNQMPGNITQVDGTYHLSDAELDHIGSPSSSVSVLQKKTSDQIKSIKVFQLDGIYDTSSDDEDDDDDDDLDDDDDDDDDDENDDKEEDHDEAENSVEEDPLNSGDDVSEGDNTDLFETENVVVCQYDKINRSRNKWKFYLKDGIMNLAGRDYIFQKANGDAEW